MKSWLTKFRISAAMDAGQPLPPSLRRAIAADPDLERFTRQAQSFGRAMRSPPPVRPGLHESIMRAVRAESLLSVPQTSKSAVPQVSKPAGRSAVPPAWKSAAQQVWKPALRKIGWAALAVVAVCLWISAHRQAPSDRQSLDGAVMVLEMSQELPNAMPSLVMSPLSDEWERVDHNLQDTTQVLLASFP